MLDLAGHPLQRLAQRLDRRVDRVSTGENHIWAKAWDAAQAGGAHPATPGHDHHDHDDHDDHDHD